MTTYLYQKRDLIQAAKHMTAYLVNHTMWWSLHWLPSLCILHPLTPPFSVVVAEVCVVLVCLSCHLSMLFGDGHWHWITPENVFRLLFNDANDQISNHVILMRLTACTVMITSVVVGLPALLRHPTLARDLFSVHRLWTGNCITASLLTPKIEKVAFNVGRESSKHSPDPVFTTVTPN